MTRFAVLILLGLAFTVGPFAHFARAGSDRAMAEALEASRHAKWDEAKALARTDGVVARDVIEWMRLRAGLGRPEEVTAFLERRPDWPGERLLRRRSERAFADLATYDKLLDFFSEHPPQTPEGALAHADALAANGESGEAQVTLVLAWRTMPMRAETQRAFLAKNRALLAPHHEARLDALLWSRDRQSAERMFPLVSEKRVALARARIALQKLAKDVDARISDVPKDLADDPGLAHDRFVWRIRKGRDESATELLIARSTSVESLGRPDAWAKQRRRLARAEMRAGNHQTAYGIAARHFTYEGSNHADLEWLAGYIALRFLDQPKAALIHFSNHDAAVVTPISKGRAGYWIGRALDAAGDPAAAAVAYSRGARYQTSFYGLLAAERAGLEPDPALSGNQDVPDWRNSDLAQRDLFIAGQLLLDAGATDLAERFWTHFAESLSESEARMLGQAALDMGSPHIAVMIGKRLARKGVTVPGPYYALHPVAEAGLPMAPEMLLAIARRESEFDASVVSGAGARGLMQVMPATARAVAAGLGLKDLHTTARLTEDPEWNARLGAAYLAELAGTFDGNPVMMAAGYNAGPGRPIRWMSERGDPRRAANEETIVDWIEHIPFNETRNYVMRVTESLPVYRARLGRNPHPVPFSQELTGDGLRRYALD